MTRSCLAAHGVVGPAHVVQVLQDRVALGGVDRGLLAVGADDVAALGVELGGEVPTALVLRAVVGVADGAARRAPAIFLAAARTSSQVAGGRSGSRPALLEELPAVDQAHRVVGARDAVDLAVDGVDVAQLLLDVVVALQLLDVRGEVGGLLDVDDVPGVGEVRVEDVLHLAAGELGVEGLGVLAGERVVRDDVDVRVLLLEGGDVLLEALAGRPWRSWAAAVDGDARLPVRRVVVRPAGGEGEGADAERDERYGGTRCFSSVDPSGQERSAAPHTQAPATSVRKMSRRIWNYSTAGWISGTRGLSGRPADHQLGLEEQLVRRHGTAADLRVQQLDGGPAHGLDGLAHGGQRAARCSSSARSRRSRRPRPVHGTSSPVRRAARTTPSASGSLAQTKPVTPRSMQPGGGRLPALEGEHRAGDVLVRQPSPAPGRRPVCAARACGRRGRAPGRSARGRGRRGGARPARRPPRRRRTPAGKPRSSMAALTRTTGMLRSASCR